ncbi:MAG: hypothetical protein Q4D23_12340, partial [Bacteroidales bacterium]|nr:hypothetical protein [Bacteroidales bacterium]
FASKIPLNPIGCGFEDNDIVFNLLIANFLYVTCSNGTFKVANIRKKARFCPKSENETTKIGDLSPLIII